MQPVVLDGKNSVLPDILFAESAWNSIGGGIRIQLREGNIVSQQLFELIEECKSHSVPTIFWNKEDVC